MAKTSNLGRREFAHVTHLQLAWQQALLEHLDPRLAVAKEERVFSTLCFCDPTANGRYLLWLSRWRRGRWVEAGLNVACSWADVRDLTRALAHFESVRRHLPAGERDVNLYREPRDLIDTQIGTNERRTYRRERKRIALLGSELRYDSGAWKLIRLKTRAAAEWWGMGTRWCTASVASGAFETYSANGDLFVMVTPVGRYQLSTGTGEFRDDADRPVNLVEVLRAAPAAFAQAISEIVP